MLLLLLLLLFDCNVFDCNGWSWHLNSIGSTDIHSNRNSEPGQNPIPSSDWSPDSGSDQLSDSDPNSDRSSNAHYNQPSDRDADPNPNPSSDLPSDTDSYHNISFHWVNTHGNSPESDHTVNVFPFWTFNITDSTNSNIEPNLNPNV